MYIEFDFFNSIIDNDVFLTCVELTPLTMAIFFLVNCKLLSLIECSFPELISEQFRCYTNNYVFCSSRLTVVE